jgi:hypothetical protein
MWCRKIFKIPKELKQKNTALLRRRRRRRTRKREIATLAASLGIMLGSARIASGSPTRNQQN